MLRFLPELCEDTLLQAQILVSVLLYHSSLPLNRVFQTPHGLSQFTADFLLCTLQLDSQRLLVLELKGRAAKQVLVWPEDQITEVGKVQTRSQVRSGGRRSCLNLSHLMELHPEVRNILPELQEVDFQRSRARVFRARVALGSQDWGATCKQKQLCVLYALCIAKTKKNLPNSDSHAHAGPNQLPCCI